MPGIRSVGADLDAVDLSEDVEQVGNILVAMPEIGGKQIGLVDCLGREGCRRQEGAHCEKSCARQEGGASKEGHGEEARHAEAERRTRRGDR